MHSHAYRLRRRYVGFTLVELLGVIACIALLLAILTPALSAARHASQTVTCGARLQQWGLAFACYANENHGRWPHCDGLDRGPRELDDPHITREDVADWFGWVDVLPPMIDMQPWRDHPRYARPDKHTFFQCPTASVSTRSGVYSYRPDRDGYFSYAMNSCLELDTNAWPPADGLGYPMPSFLDTAKIAGPARVMTLFDQLLDPQLGYGGESVCRSAGKHCGGYPRAFSARHARGQSKLGGNILYADGHVAWLATVWKTEWPDDLEVPPRDDVDWYPYPSE
ncbi:MAG: type II secretion system protein [Phycisphaerae bacterium]|nr:type II secretion system protein [Phycisphaerae bacterium]